MRFILALSVLPLAASVDQQAASYANAVSGIHGALAQITTKEHQETRIALEALMKEAEGEQRLSPEQEGVFNQISGILDTILNTLRGSTTDMQPQLDAITNVIAGCNAHAVHDSVLSQAMTDKAGIHQTCREEEEDLFVIDAQKCGEVVTFLEGLSVEPCEVAHVDLAHIDEWGTLLTRVKNWFENNQPLYVVKRDECSNSTKNLADKKTECDDDQADFENAFCQYQSSAQSGCDSQDECYDREKGDHETLEGVQIPLSESRVAVVRLILHIKCLIGRLIGGLDINESPYDNCPLLDLDATELVDYTLVSVPVPAKDSCTLINGVPGTAAFKDDHYNSWFPADLTVHSTGVTC